MSDVIDTATLTELIELGEKATERNPQDLEAFHDAAANLAIPLALEVRRLREQKDGAYRERDALVCALSKLFPAWLGRHPESDTSWDNDWRWIVFVDAPCGQTSWHIHDSERSMFDHLEWIEDDEHKWDGHTTEEKYRRLESIDAE